MEIQPVERMVHKMVIAVGQAGEPLPMRRTAERDDLRHGQGEVGGLFLQDGGDAPGHLPLRHGVNIRAVDQDAPGARPVIAVDQPQQGRFAGAVRAEHARGRGRAAL